MVSDAPPHTLYAENRTTTGTSAARALRRKGRLPAVVYGTSAPPRNISLDARELHRLTSQPGFYSRVFALDVEGEKERILPRDLARNPVTDAILHADFMRVSESSEISVMVSVRFKDEDKCPGLKMGGIVNVVRRQIELLCRADSIPPHVEVSLQEKEIGESIHISSVSLPKQVKLVIADRDFTIATIVAPKIQMQVEPSVQTQEEAEKIQETPES